MPATGLQAIPLDSPLYPLPEDYYDLTTDGQRMARVNACRQWLIRSTDNELNGTRRVASLRFFDENYLWPDGDFDPGFYDDIPAVTPNFHWDMVRMWGMYRFAIFVAPRGAAKSTNIKRDSLMLIVTAPRYSLGYCTSTHINAERVGVELKDQCYNNARIQADFGPEYDVTGLKPSRGDKPTGNQFFYLMNGSWVRTLSTKTKMRGFRPRRFRMDDPEYDAEASTSLSQLREDMQVMLFKVVVPMVLRARTGIDWTGTFVSQRHYLWSAYNTIKMPDGSVKAEDPRFNKWARMLVKAVRYDEDSKRYISCWPHMWPSDEKEKKELGLDPTTVTIPEIREIMGPPAFNAEMLAEPGQGDGMFFQFNPDPYGPHAWWLDSIDELAAADPKRSASNMCWLNDEGEIQKIPLYQFLKTARLFMTVDTAYTENATSDRRCCTLMAWLPGNLLFVLDMWADRKKDSLLIENSFRITEKWGNGLICVEVVKESKRLYSAFQHTVKTNLIEKMGYSRIPSIKPLNPGTDSKMSKIETLDVRFEHNLIKLPVFQRTSRPWWARLFDQIECYNPQADAAGGLEHDDEIDTVSMSLLVLRGYAKRWAKSQEKKESTGIDTLAFLESGKTHYQNIPLGLGLDITSTPASTIAKILESRGPNRKGGPVQGI